MYCVALDPGGTTGVCLVKSKSEPWNLETDEFGPKPHHQLLLHHLTLWKPEVIVCEAFENVTNEAARLVSLEYIGIVKLYMQQRFTICEVVFQAAGVAKPFWTDSKLRRCKLLPRGKHERDAVRHYLWYQTFTRKDESLLRKHFRPGQS